MAFKLNKEGFVGLVAPANGVEGILGEFVVVAVVAEGGSALGKVAQIGLVLLFEKRILGGEAISNGFEILCENGSGHGDDDE